MTVSHLRSTGSRSRHRRALPLLLLLILFLLFSPLVTGEIQKALALCARVILPTLFPFTVLSELLCGILGEDVPNGAISRQGIIYRLFGVPASAMSAFMLGALCGFPLGVKQARGLYDAGVIDGRECTRLLCFVNNTGPAFVIAGVGGALFSSFSFGVILYVIQLVSALVTGFIFARFPCATVTKKGGSAPKPGGNPAAAITRSAITMLSVCGTVVFFSAICALLSHFCQNDVLLQFIYPFLEVSGACNLAAECYSECGFLSLFSAMLAISFGGAAVHMQALLFFEEGFPLRRYIAAKLTQAAIACLLLAVVFPFLK